MPPNRHLRHVTVLLAAIATVQVQIAVSVILPGAGIVELAVAVLLACLLWATLGRRVSTAWEARSAIAVLAIGLLPLAWEPVSRVAMSVGLPYEIQLTLVLRNAVLALVAVQSLPRATINAALGSLFLVVFCSMWSTGAWSFAVLALYSVAGVWWLLASYWDRLGGRFADSSETAVPVRPAAATIVILLLLGAAMVPLANRIGVTTALAGFFPSSGGTQWSDPFANGGVGDGDQMVAGKDNATSFGPIDCDLFLESKMPSLYDAFNEFSDAPPRKTKRARRAIPLAPSQVRENHEKTGVNQQATREFSAVRQQTSRRRKLGDLSSAALLHVTGRTPQHLALETFDRWDGHSLIACDSGVPLHTELESVSTGQRWMKLAVDRPARAFQSRESSQVRVINLKTDRVPTPAGASAVTMKGLHAASMFTFADDGSLAMNVERVPQLTVFDFKTTALARDQPLPLHQASTDQTDGVIAKLAREWTDAVPAGWPQVEAIVNQLAKRCTHDREALVPPEVDDAVEYFLSESKRGPDYLFATSASLLLRSLGYDTRVRAGFYASPERYERVAKLTPVLMEDAHFWVEVRTAAGARTSRDGESLPGVWVTVEPTPGYQLLYAPETLLARLWRLTSKGLAAVASAPLASMLSLAGVAIVFATRRRLLDGLIIAWWSIRSRTSEAGRMALITLRLLEWRAWAYKESRPAGTPIGRWGVLNTHEDFASLASWALYGSGSTAPPTAGAARAVCRRAINTSFATKSNQMRRAT
ncbi:MAG: transglutaminase-like domain-containing protein [Planctomycetota bacterium]